MIEAGMNSWIEIWMKIIKKAWTVNLMDCCSCFFVHGIFMPFQANVHRSKLVIHVFLD
ncbi:hypothetical protein J2S25_001422 [Mesobacillus stamsii]|uniref:Uncharacterized protein n=1 Tax=Mesobacillus stamsii TaxID=225347 RepID=A0ABU0FTI1_9BACI|nr:hypothetical protein [Mesobacillus stamsii]